MEKDKDDIKYLQIVYNNINQLIEMIQSYQDTINSTRDLFSSSISLQINETMRVSDDFFCHHIASLPFDRCFRLAGI